MAPTSPRLLADALSAYAVTMLEKALPCSFSCASEAKGALAEAGKSGGFDDAHEQTPERTHVVGSPLDAVKTWLQDEQVPQSIKEAFVEQLEQTQQSDEILRLVTDFCGYHAPLHPSHEDPRPKAARQLESVSPQASLSEKKKAEMAMEKTIPAAFGCAICCGELMLRPASLACGHSFCRCCLNLWLKNCTSCPTCRHPTPPLDTLPNKQVAVNLALQEMMTMLYPEETKELAQQDEMERLHKLREMIYQSLKDGGSQDIRSLVAQIHQRNGHGLRQEHHLAVTTLLNNDKELQERVLAAEIRERLRKEKLLRESSRQRHMSAYCQGPAEFAAAAAAVRSGASTTSSRKDNNKDGNRNSTEASRTKKMFASILGRHS